MQDFGCFNLKTDFNYKFVHSFNVNEIVNHINTNTSINWATVGEFDPTYFLYKDIEALPLVDVTSSFTKTDTDDLITHIIPANIKIVELISTISDYLVELTDGVILRSSILRLLPHGKIPTFQHKGLQSRIIRKFHIALETNELTFFRVGGEHKYMMIGQCWEINNNEKFSFWNLGETNRTDLIIDILPRKL